jgi:hypothetical protein
MPNKDIDDCMTTCLVLRQTIDKLQKDGSSRSQGSTSPAAEPPVASSSIKLKKGAVRPPGQSVSPVPLRNQTQISLLERPDDAITALPAHEIPEEAQDDQAYDYAASEPPQGNAKKSRWSRIQLRDKAKWNSIRQKNKRAFELNGKTQQQLQHLCVQPV